MHENYGIKTARAPRREMLEAQRKVRQRHTRIAGMARVASKMAEVVLTGDPLAKF